MCLFFFSSDIIDAWIILASLCAKKVSDGIRRGIFLYKEFGDVEVHLEINGADADFTRISYSNPDFQFRNVLKFGDVYRVNVLLAFFLEMIHNQFTKNSFSKIDNCVFLRKQSISSKFFSAHK